MSDGFALVSCLLLGLAVVFTSQWIELMWTIILLGNSNLNFLYIFPGGRGNISDKPVEVRE